MENQEKEKQEEFQTEEQKAFEKQLKEAGIVAEQSPPSMEPSPALVPEKSAKDKKKEEVPKRIAEGQSSSKPETTTQEGLHILKEEVVTPRQEMQVIKSQIRGLDQKVEKAEERHRDVLRGGFVAEVGPVTRTEIDSLEKEKLAQVGELNETRKMAKEKALEVLSDPQVMKRSPRELAESFRHLTENENGEHRRLARERNEMAYSNERERGRTVLIGKDAVEKYRQTATEKIEEKIHAEERSAAITTCWDRLTEKQKGQLKDVNSLDFENYLEEKKQKLGISENAFASLVQRGFKPEAAKVRGWTKWFGLAAVEIPSTEAKTFLISDGSKGDINKWVEDNHNRVIREEASKRVESKIIEGRKRLLSEKNFCTKKIIKEAVGNYNLAKQKKPTVEAVPEEETTIEKKQKQTGKREKKKPAPRKKLPNGSLKKNA